MNTGNIIRSVGIDLGIRENNQKIDPGKLWVSERKLKKIDV